MVSLVRSIISLASDFGLPANFEDWDKSCEIALRSVSLEFSDDKSTLVQVMAWCRQAASHYQSQCWPRSVSPYGITRPQWVNYWANPRFLQIFIIIEHVCFFVMINQVRSGNTCLRQWTGASLIQVVALHLCSDELLSESGLAHCLLN